MSNETDSTPSSSKTAAKTTSTSTASKQDAQEVTRDQLAEDLRKTIADARAYLDQLTTDGKGMARARAQQTQEQVQDWREQGEDMIRRKPLTSVAIALGVGYILGKLGD